MSSLVLESPDGVTLEMTPTTHPFDGGLAELPTREARLTAKGLEAMLAHVRRRVSRRRESTAKAPSGRLRSTSRM